MVEIADLRDCAPSGLFYGGRAGQKEGILIEGEPWIAKYPRTTRDLMGKHLPSYTSSPVPEYLGSHIYELLGIPVHETMLGYRAGKIVCACRDFTFPNARLFEFREIKNALSDDDAGFSSAPSDGEVILLGDVLAAIETSDLLRRVPGVRERFWDMFVADAFIKNPDRNNGNWGVLMTAPMTYELAPVYDMGSSLFSKRSPSVAAHRLGDEEAEREDAFGTNVSCYRLLRVHGEDVEPRSDRRHQALCSRGGHERHRRAHRQRARGGLRHRASIGFNARGAQAAAEKTSRRGYSSASVNKAACQCGIRGYCLSK